MSNRYKIFSKLLSAVLLSMLLGLFLAPTFAETNPLEKETLENLEAKANAGDARAQCNLGFIYRDGEGVEKDYTKAFALFRKAAVQDNAKAQGALGFTYAKGLGVEKNEVIACKWWKIAAEQGDAISQFNLALHYYNGEGVGKNLKNSIMWFKKAAEQGHASAQEMLGTLYMDGEGVEKDQATAIKLFQKAAAQGSVWAKVDLGQAYMNGDGVEKSLTQAAQFFRQALESKNLNKETQAKVEEYLSDINDELSANGEETVSIPFNNPTGDIKSVPIERIVPTIRVKNQAPNGAPSQKVIRDSFLDMASMMADSEEKEKNMRMIFSIQTWEIQYGEPMVAQRPISDKFFSRADFRIVKNAVSGRGNISALESARTLVPAGSRIYPVRVNFSMEDRNVFRKCKEWGIPPESEEATGKSHNLATLNFYFCKDSYGDWMIANE